jgi:hypothetical protein
VTFCPQRMCTSLYKTAVMCQTCRSSPVGWGGGGVAVASGIDVCDSRGGMVFLNMPKPLSLFSNLRKHVVVSHSAGR